MKNLFDYGCERAVLAGIFCDNDVYDSIGLTAEDFYGAANAEIYRTIGELLGKGDHADLLTVETRLREKGAKAGARDLADIDPVTAANVSFYSEKVREYSKKRQLWKLAEAVFEKTNSLAETSGDIMEEVERRLTDISDRNLHELRKIGVVLKPAIDMIEARFLAKGKLDGLSTGYHAMDKVLGGMKNGSLIIIASRPSIGKTALALSIALNLATRETIDVGFFSCEMTAEQLTIRAIAGLGRINSHNISTGFMTASEFGKMQEAASILYAAPLTIDDTASIELATLKSRARQMKRQGISIIFVDYLTLIRYGDLRMPKWERTGEVSKSLKNLARELDIPIVVLSQVGREAEGHMPSLANLRLSGEIEEDSDVVIFLHRERVTGDHDVIGTTVEIAKNRYGATDQVQLAFLPKYVLFQSTERSEM